MKKLIKKIEPHVELFRDEKTGMAWIENGSTGMYHTVHPNIHRSGSVRGMKKLRYWDWDDKTVRTNGYIYNVSRKAVSDKLDEIVEEYCKCEGCR